MLLATGVEAADRESATVIVGDLVEPKQLASTDDGSSLLWVVVCRASSNLTDIVAVDAWSSTGWTESQVWS